MIINENIIEILTKYLQAIKNYNKFFFDNISLHKNIDFIKTLHIKGILLINNIFSISLLYVDSLVDICNICEKGYIYFIEFINQIYITNTFENNSFELTLKDAIIFSYKKTIFSFENNIQINISDTNKYKLKIIDECINIINTLSKIFTNNIYILFDNINDSNNNISDDINSSLLNINKITSKVFITTDLYNKETEYHVNYINYFKNINNFLNVINNNYKLNKDNTNYSKNLYIFIEKYITKKIFTKKININNFLNINSLNLLENHENIQPILNSLCKIN